MLNQRRGFSGGGGWTAGLPPPAGTGGAYLGEALRPKRGIFRQSKDNR
jgi:hypothetical protein